MQLITSEKHQKSFLGGLERLLGNSPNSDDLLAAGTTSKVLMALYQADVLDEEVARQWGTHVSKKYVDKDKSKKVRKSADAFLKVCLLNDIGIGRHMPDLFISGSKRPTTKARRSDFLCCPRASHDSALSPYFISSCYPCIA